MTSMNEPPLSSGAGTDELPLMPSPPSDPGRPTPGPAPGMLAPLGQHPFRWLMSGRFAGYLGNAVAPIALAFAVLDLTGSVASLGLVVGARSIANVALLLFGGVVADRLPRPLVLQGSSYVAALTQAVVAASVIGGFATIPLLLVLSAVNGAVAAMSMPAAAALTPQTVPANQLRQANALLRMTTSFAMVSGAAAGGAVVALVGPGWGIAIDAATFLVAGLCYSRVRLAPVEAIATPSRPMAELREGWSEFTSRPWVWVVVVQFMVVNACLVGGVMVLGPAIADETIGRQAWGVVLAAQTVGFIAGGLVALRWQARRALRLGVLLTSAEVLPLLALGAAPKIVVLVAAFFLAGMAMEQFGIAWDVSLQENVPADRLARVYSYDMLGSFVAIPIGQVTVGPLAELVGREETLVGAAVLVLLATAAALTSRSVRTLTRHAPEPVAAAVRS